MTRERLSRLQRDILAWLVAEDVRLRGTMAAEYQALVACSFDKGNLSRSLANLEAKGLIRITRTDSGKAEAVDITPAGRRAVVNKL